MLPWKEIGGYLEGSVEKTFETLFSTLDGIEGEVKVLLDKDLQLSRDQLAQEIIGEAAKQTAVIGGTAALPDILPTSWPVIIPSICADFGLTLRSQLSMLLKLAYLFGPDHSRDDRKREAIGILATYGAPDDEKEKGSAVTFSKDMAMIGSKHVGNKALVTLGRKLGERFIRRKLAAIIPVFGIAFSSGVNYFSTHNLGEFARKYYLARKFSDSDSASLSSEVQHFQRCYLRVMVNMAKVDKQVTAEEEGLLKDSLVMFGYSREEQEKLLKELHDLDNAMSLAPEEVDRLSEDDRRFILKQAIAMMYADRKKSIQEANYLEVLRKRFNVDTAVALNLEDQVKKEMGVAGP